MAITCGIDIGLVSIKLAVMGSESDRDRLEELARRCSWLSTLPGDDGYLNPEAPPILVSKYRRIRGRPAEVAGEILSELLNCLPPEEIHGIRLIGSGSRLVSTLSGLPLENEFRAIAHGFGVLYPGVRTVFEMGGETSKYIMLERDPDSGSVGIADYETSGDCAAGTGSFIDQQASRLKFKVEEIGKVVTSTTRAPQIAGRCSVFAKSDMIHAQQKGYQPAEVMRGLCQAVARNFKSAIVKGKQVLPPVAFIGGMAANTGVLEALTELFGLDGQLFVPVYFNWIGAVGAAEIAANREPTPVSARIGEAIRRDSKLSLDVPAENPLNLDRVVLLRDRVKPYRFKGDEVVDAYLGIDIGSVSTNLVVIDREGNVIKEIYTRTEARPIQVVAAGLREIERELAGRIRIRGVGTTGSGRELIGQLVGADTINDEITAHKTGASFIADKLLGSKVDTIFEIGGQDSKFIRLNEGIVVDFAMNEACAAGTGSFLEERCEELDISIYGQFAQLALSSKRPVRLGERCTVFMEQDVNAYLKRGVPKEDLLAGLAYSVVHNYINRVVRGRDIGDHIFFQGGTAYNDAVAAAFSMVLGKEIVVPPHNGVMGAIGVALLARDKMEQSGQAESKFRGFNLDQVNYSLREFTCKGCSNYCTIQEFTVEGEKTYWGDKCSDRYRKRVRTGSKAVVPDLITKYHELLFRDYDGVGGGKPVVGIPRALYVYDRFPFWNAFFRELGFQVYLTDETNNRVAHRGEEATVAEPCFPIMVAHGHVLELVDKDVDYIFLPNQMNAETPFTEVKSHVCPWGQTLPWVVRRSPPIATARSRLLSPKVEFREGREWVARQLEEFFAGLGIGGGTVRRAVAAAYRELERFRRDCLEAGRQALSVLEKNGSRAIVMVGRPYNLYDRGVNLSVAHKIRDYYGVNVIPMDFLDIDNIPVSDVNDNMYWNYGRRILAAAKFVAGRDDLHIIHVTNFKCGPDSYIKHFIARASGKPFLSLQFDGHSNDAGVITRCEAYLDSKGFLRSWSERKAS